jgi:transcriptional regulator with XRE-family HTH domain
MEHPVRALRRQRGLTLEQAAAEIKTSKGNLSRIETGAHGASDDLKRRIYEWSGGTITPNDLVNLHPAGEAA